MPPVVHYVPPVVSPVSCSPWPVSPTRFQFFPHTPPRCVSAIRYSHFAMSMHTVFKSVVSDVYARFTHCGPYTVFISLSDTSHDTSLLHWLTTHHFNTLKTAVVLVSMLVPHPHSVPPSPLRVAQVSLTQHARDCGGSLAFIGEGGPGPWPALGGDVY